MNTLAMVLGYALIVTGGIYFTAIGVSWFVINTVDHLKIWPKLYNRIKAIGRAENMEETNEK